MNAGLFGKRPKQSHDQAFATAGPFDLVHM